MPSLQKYSPAFDHVWVHQVEEQWPFGRNKRQTATFIQERKESGKGLSLSLSLSLSLFENRNQGNSPCLARLDYTQASAGLFDQTLNIATQHLI